MATSESLDHFLDRAWAQHAEDAEHWACRLQQETPAPQTPTELQALVRFTMHVLAHHLGRFDDARWRLSALVSHEQADASVQLALRLAAASLSLAEHGTAVIDVFAPADQIKALAQSADIASGQRQPARARALLARARGVLMQLPSIEAAVARPLAVACNNIAWELHDLGDQRTTDETAAMLDMAAASKIHWAQAGTWLEVQRADYALARMHVAAGLADAAAVHAQACWQACQDNAAPACEWFFAHEAQALAAAARRQAASAQNHVQQAQVVFNTLSADDQAACRSALDALRALVAA